MKTRARHRGGGKAVLTAKNGRKHRANTRKRHANVRHANKTFHKGLNIRKLMSRLKKGRKLASRTRSVKKYNRANLQSLIDFLDEIDDMDEQAIKRSDGEFRDKLIFFIIGVLGEIEGAVDTLKYMLPASEMNEEENNAADDLDDLIGALTTMRIAPAESDPFETIDKVKDVLENLLEEYKSNDIQEEARVMYGDAIDMIVDAFIKAIRKHAHELKAAAVAPSAAAAAAPENNLARMFSKLGF